MSSISSEFSGQIHLMKLPLGSWVKGGPTQPTLHHLSFSRLQPLTKGMGTGYEPIGESLMNAVRFVGHRLKESHERFSIDILIMKEDGQFHLRVE